MRPNLTPQQRSMHAKEWYAWRKDDSAGARRGWVYLRNYANRSVNANKLLVKMGMRVPVCSRPSIAGDV